MSQQYVSNHTSTPDKVTNDDGLPKTPYAIAVGLVGVITAYTFFFQLWDASELPETFNNATYWVFLSLIFLSSAVVSAILVGRRRHFDTFVICLLFLGSIGSIIILSIVDRQATPQNEKFTVALFTFTDHSSTQNLGESFRDNIQRALESRFQGEITVLQRNREIKGEKIEDKISEARKWGMRRSGCHLALWVELSNEQANYVIKPYFVGVKNFGSPKTNEVASLEDTIQKYMVQDPANGPISQDRVGEIVRSIAKIYGLASYQRGDYGAAIRSLSNLDDASAQYFAGRSALELAWHGTSEARRLFGDAESYYLHAIKLDPDGAYLQGRALDSLGQTYFYVVNYGLSDYPHGDAERAIAAFSQAGDFYSKRGEWSRYAWELTRKAHVRLELAKIAPDPEAAQQEMIHAERILNEALSYLTTESEYYSDIQNLLGFIYSKRHKYVKAVAAHENALQYFRSSDQQFFSQILAYLAWAQAEHAAEAKNVGIYKTSLDRFRQAFEACEKVSARFGCYAAHNLAGMAALSWADTLRDGSPNQIREIERAMTEFGVAASLISRTEQAPLYAQAKESFARAVTERASTATGNERLQLLTNVISALGEGIDALNAKKLDASSLYRKRAECYERLALDSDQSAIRTEYRQLAKRDLEFAKAWAAQALVVK